MEFTLSGKTNKEEAGFKRTCSVSLLEYANKKRHLDSFNDVVICAGSERLPANKLVLSCFSPFFEKMFEIEMKEKYQNYVHMNYVYGDTMKILIEYIYTGKVNINSDNVCKLLCSSDYLQLEDVKKFCFDFLFDAMTPDNCFTMLGIASRYLHNGLKSSAIKTIAENLDVTSYKDDFKRFTKDELVEYIFTQNETIPDQASVFNAIVRWAKEDGKNRIDEFRQLIQLVKLENLSHVFLQEHVLKEDLVLQDHKLCQLFLEFQTNRLKLISPRDQDSRIIRLGGDHSSSRVIEVFTCPSTPSSVYPDLPEGRESGCAVVLRGCLYYVGGYYVNCESSNTVWKMSLFEEELKWKEVASMKEDRYWFGCCPFNDCLVVAGGNDDENYKASVEVYSPELNSWKHACPMIRRKQANALVECKGCLYSIGGQDDDTCLSSVERLSSIDGKWEDVQPMPTPRRQLAAVSCDGYIYAIGGHCGYGDSTSLKSCEKYDPSTNDLSYICQMKFKRSLCSACVLRGNILVVGGVDQKGRAVKEVECYNPSIDKWCIVGKTIQEIFDHTVVAT